MRHTFKATFEHQNDAQGLMDDLYAAGYAHAELARSGSTHSGPYTRQRHAVMLSVNSESEASLAAGIIERSKPVRFQVDRNESVDSVTAGAPAKDGIVSAYPPGAEPGILQFRPLDDGHIFGTQSATSPPAGTTYQEKMGTASLRAGVDTFASPSSVTARWTDKDLGTDALERAAYRFGVALRMSDRYRNRSWNEAEPSLKSEWSLDSPDSLTWDNANSSVRRGWDETTPEIDDDDYYRSHWTTNYAHDAGGHSGDDATPAYMDKGAPQGSEGYLGRNAGGTGQLSSWDRFEDAVFHGWKRINLTGRDPGRASGTEAIGEAHCRSTAQGEAAGLDRASGAGDDKERLEQRISQWNKVRKSMQQGWKRVRT